MTMWPAAAALLLILTGLPAGAEAPMRRLTLRQDLLGWEAVGRVEIGRGGYCTGVLIAPDLVLTAAHCLYRDGTGYVPPSTLRFRAGLSDGVALAESDVLRSVVHPDHDPGARDVVRRVRHDIGLLQLRTPVSLAVAAPFRTAALTAGAGALSVVSYGQGRDEAPSWDETCSVVGRGEGLIAFDCDVTFGSSGAPVFHRGAGQRATLVSLVSSGADADRGRFALGMALPGAVGELKAALGRGEGAVAAGQVPAAGAAVPRRLVPAIGAASGAAGGAKFVRP